MTIPALIAVSLFIALFLLILMLALFGGPTDGALRDYMRQVADRFGLEIGPLGYLEGDIDGHPLTIMPRSGGKMVISCQMHPPRPAFALVDRTLPDTSGMAETSLRERDLPALAGQYKLYAAEEVDFLQPFARRIAASPCEMIVGGGDSLSVYCDSHILTYTLDEIDDILSLVLDLSRPTAEAPHGRD
jgi:hypothetical protein